MDDSLPPHRSDGEFGPSDPWLKLARDVLLRIDLRHLADAELDGHAVLLKISLRFAQLEQTERQNQLRLFPDRLYELSGPELVESHDQLLAVVAAIQDELAHRAHDLYGP